MSMPSLHRESNDSLMQGVINIGPMKLPKLPKGISTVNGYVCKLKRHVLFQQLPKSCLEGTHTIPKCSHNMKTTIQPVV